MEPLNTVGWGWGRAFVGRGREGGRVEDKSCACGGLFEVFQKRAAAARSKIRRSPVVVAMGVRREGREIWDLVLTEFRRWRLVCQDGGGE